MMSWFAAIGSLFPRSGRPTATNEGTSDRPLLPINPADTIRLESVREARGMVLWRARIPPSRPGQQKYNRLEAYPNQR